MPPRIVLLSGRIGAGKSTLADALVSRYGAHRVKTREIIRRLFPDEPLSRETLQKHGDVLDETSGGKWVSNGILVDLNEFYKKRVESGDAPDPNLLVVVDGVRIAKQIEHIRADYGRNVTHVHLSVSPEIVDTRLAQRPRAFPDSTYEEARRNPTESKVEDLAAIADIHVDTERDRPDDVVMRVAALLGLLASAAGSFVDILVGGQYGSEGKGHISWYLAPEYDYLMRVGGPNAGHTVLSRGEFVFHVLPSGTDEAPHAKLILGPGTTISLERLREEISKLNISSQRLFIDPHAVVIEQADRDFEAATIKDTIASTAQGGGYAAARRLMRGALEPSRPLRFAEDVSELQPFKRATADVIQEAVSKGARIFLEGTQGAGLSLFHGDWPYVTSRDTNVGGLLAESGIAWSWIRKVIMVVRPYPIRVQDPDAEGTTSGTMSREISWDIVAERSGQDAETIKQNERTSTTNRKRRVGEFDWVLYRNSVQLNRPTDIALTFADYITKENEGARRFNQLSKETQAFISELEAVGEAPVSLVSTGFHNRSIIDRRQW